VANSTRFDRRCRIDDLEKSIAELMNQAGVEPPGEKEYTNED
jgi:hypothetical protein